MHPILFEIGPFTIRTYGVTLAIAFLTGFSLMYYKAKRINFYPDKILDLQMCMVIFGVLGARLLHVFLNLDVYRSEPVEIFMIWRGGLAFQGGLLAGVFASWAYIKINKLPLFKLADFLMPYIALGQAIGRIGCYFNGCCFGKYAAFPTQILSSAGLVLIFTYLSIIENKKPFDGFIVSRYFILYGTLRFFMDFIRADLYPFAFGLTVSQFLSAGIIFLGVLAFILGRRNAKI